MRIISLEHKESVSRANKGKHYSPKTEFKKGLIPRGGNNEYNNLGIACQRCNCKKHTKTEEEFRKEIFQNA